MSDLREIITDWTLPSGTGHATVMYFDSAQPVATQRSQLGTFWNSIRAFQATTAVYSIRSSGRTLESTTGSLTGAWTEPTVFTAAGSAGTLPVPDASQALIQWRTPLIVNGRFLRGRTFIPSLGSGHMAAGNVLPASAASIQTIAATLAAASGGLRIWHRPGPAGPGADFQVGSVTVWPEFAVLRRRRN